MSRAKAKPFQVSRVTCDYDSVPRIAVLQGMMRIDGSPQANFRQIYARLTLAEAERLEGQLHRSICAIREAMLVSQ